MSSSATFPSQEILNLKKRGSVFLNEHQNQPEEKVNQRKLLIYIYNSRY